MKCIYCEENEAKGVLLCYGCQVDLFPLVSAWVYCGVCGNELPDSSAICPKCAQTETVPAPIAESSELQSAPALSQQMVIAPARKIHAAQSPLIEPQATRDEIKKARRFQWAIRTAMAVFWITILVLILMWARDFVNQPIDNVYP